MTDDERIEKVLSEMENIKPARLDVSFFLAKQLNDEDDSSFRRVISALESLRLARSVPSTPLLEILPEGSVVVKSGGYEKYVERIKLEQEEDARLRKICTDLDELNLRKARFEYRWRWLSVAAIIISISALVISLIK